MFKSYSEREVDFFKFLYRAFFCSVFTNDQQMYWFLAAYALLNVTRQIGAYQPSK
jgi:hypothetical protein